MRTDTLFRIGGCAGSFAAPSENRPLYDASAPWTIRREPFRRELYGSRTTCFFLRHKDTYIVIDHGLGIEPVSEFLLDMLDAEGRKDTVIHCLQTHFHEDHLSGLRANALLFRKGLTLHFYSPDLSKYHKVDEDLGGEGPLMHIALQTHFRESFWPVTLDMLDQIGARREHHVFQLGDTLQFDAIRVHTLPLAHPGGCAGLRFEIPRVGSIVVATDYEPPEQPDSAIVEFCNGAALLIADMQYRDDEYHGLKPIGRMAMPRKGWGHGTPQRLLPMILKCPNRPQRVRMVHHDPKRSDMELRMYYEETVNQLEEWKAFNTFDYEFAHDGDMYWY